MKNLFPLLFILIIISCTGPQLLTQSGKSTSEEFSAGNFQAVFPVLKNYISTQENKGKELPDSLYYQAGFSALQLDSAQYAIRYLEKIAYKDSATDKSQWALALAYQKIDNLSKEIRILNQLVRQHPHSKHILQYKSRLFETLISSENYDNAKQLWPDLQAEAIYNQQLTEYYLRMDEESGFTKEGIEKARALYKSNKQNVVALHYLATYYFTQAENRYQLEMDAYNANKTNSQYKRLLKELKIASADYRKARDYYLSLFKLNQDAKTADRLYRVYARLNNKQKAEYYKKLSKG